MTARDSDPTPYALALGDRLKAAREEAGLSQFDVERKSLGRWKAVVVGSYERADRRITPERLIDYAEFLGADPVWLFLGERPLPVDVTEAVAAERSRIVALIGAP